MPRGQSAWGRGNSGMQRRFRQARQRVLAAASQAGSEDSSSESESTASNSPSGNESKQMVQEAVRSATMSPPTKNSLDTMDGRERVVEMARSPMADPTEPDWHDNPDNLDTPGEVRASLRADGLDPMDTETQQQASFGHMLVHSYADDPDRGGRTPAQLEAEHDMVTAALDDHGVDHDSPMDVVGGGELAFGDPYRAGDTGGVSMLGMGDDADGDADSWFSWGED